MNPHLRTALRWVVYIRTMGGEPVPYRNGSHREWALALQRQHERLRRAMDPEVARVAKSSAKGLIRQKGYRWAAEEAMRVQVATGEAGDDCRLAGPEHKIGTIVAQTIALPSEVEEKVRRLAELQCRRKLRHPNYWSAVQHALHLGRDVRTYACPVCEGIHCGNPPESDLTRQYRRARKRLRAIESRLVALDDEWIALLREKKGLLRHVGEPDMLGAMLSEITGQFRRLAELVKLWIGTAVIC